MEIYLDKKTEKILQSLVDCRHSIDISLKFIENNIKLPDVAESTLAALQQKKENLNNRISKLVHYSYGIVEGLNIMQTLTIKIQDSDMNLICNLLADRRDLITSIDKLQSLNEFIISDNSIISSLRQEVFKINDNISKLLGYSYLRRLEAQLK